MADNQQNNPGEYRPDISFGGSSPSGGASGNATGGTPRQGYNGYGNNNGNNNNYDQNTQYPQGGRSAQARPQGGYKGNRPQQQVQFGNQNPYQNKGRPAQNTPQRSAPAPERSGGAAVKRKKKFTKKQAMQVTALILMLILIFGLAVFLVFKHYYDLINHEVVEISNSSPMTYSDVDLSRADTFEKAVEDEKLKQLTEQAEKITSEEVMNILLIGEDLRDTAKESREVGNTDVMMLISVNKKDNTITLTSLMRDCYVYFEDENGYYYSDRINSAYWYGGIKLTKKVVEDYMKVHIDRYVLVNFKVFIDIVDALGGIDMYVSDLEANGDPDAPRSDKEHRGMQNPLDEQNKYLGNKVKTDYIKKGGDLHLNGNQALAYARLRYVGDADFDRTKRQRKVINEMIKESRRMSLVQMDQLANKVFPQVTTDVTMGEMAGLLLEMLNYRNYKVQEMRVPADNTFTNEFIDGKAVLSVDFEANVKKFRKKAYGTVEFKEKEKSEDGKALE